MSHKVSCKKIVTKKVDWKLTKTIEKVLQQLTLGQYGHL